METSLMLCHLATPVPNWKFLLGVKELQLPIKHCCLWKYSLPPPSFPLSVWITLCFWFAILSLYRFLKWGCALAIGPQLHLFLLVYLYVKNSVINNLFFQFISLWENGGGDLICCDRHHLPDRETPKEAAYQIIGDELMLDGNSCLNLASFATIGWSQIATNTFWSCHLKQRTTLTWMSTLLPPRSRFSSGSLI